MILLIFLSKVPQFSRAQNHLVKMTDSLFSPWRCFARPFPGAEKQPCWAEIRQLNLPLKDITFFLPLQSLEVHGMFRVNNYLDLPSPEYQ